jgi:hypothetical protein
MTSRCQNLETGATLIRIALQIQRRTTERGCADVGRVPIAALVQYRARTHTSARLMAVPGAPTSKERVS